MADSLVVINADDLGLSPGVNRGIFRAHRDGAVSSASLMATGEAFVEACEELRAHPDLGIGAHLALTTGAPVSPPETVPSLVDASGRFHSLGSVARRLLTGAISRAEIFKEFNAQIERIQRAGVPMDHLDGHHHLHAFPSVFSIVTQLARAHGIAWVRLSSLSGRIDFVGAPLVRLPMALGISLVARTSAIAIKAPRMPEALHGLMHTGDIAPSWLARAISAAKPGAVTEIVLHPAEGDDMPEGSHGPAQRQQDLRAALAPEVQAALTKPGIVLTHFGELAQGALG